MHRSIAQAVMSWKARMIAKETLGVYILARQASAGLPGMQTPAVRGTWRPWPTWAVHPCFSPSSRRRDANSARQRTAALLMTAASSETSSLATTHDFRALDVSPSALPSAPYVANYRCWCEAIIPIEFCASSWRRSDARVANPHPAVRCLADDVYFTSTCLTVVAQEMPPP